MSGPAILTRRARADLRNALLWVANENPAAARTMNDLVLSAASAIGNHPGIGVRRVPLAGERYRFWSMPRFPYLLVYTDATDPPRIVRVVHMARDLGPLLAELRD